MAAQQNNARAEQNKRKTGRRLTVMIIFIANVILIPFAITPLAEVPRWFVSDWPDIQLMAHGMFLLAWSAMNGVGVWAAWMGD